ncbi:unnamed protein product [Ectocarpus fasciculatus]
MVFEVRDARIPFTSANDDLDKIVGPSKARLIVLNKARERADLSNQALEQRVLQRFKEQGKTAVYACGRTGTNVNKLLAWARERGARRGEFSTTGAIAMVVGMPNVGKSSLINLLRGKANRRGGGGGGGGEGEGAKQVARVGAMPGVTRQVSAFRIASNPPLYLVDTPGVMVPRVESKAAGLFLALTRAVPDSAVPPDVLVGFMLRLVRSRRSSGARDRSAKAPSAPRATSEAAARRPTAQQPRQSKAIAAWLLQAAGKAEGTTDADAATGPSSSDDYETSAVGKHRQRRQAGGEHDDLEPGDDDRDREDREREDDMEALLEAVERESGAEGKPAPEARRICCRFLLDAFGDGQFGRITLDSVPRRRVDRKNEAELSSGTSTGRAQRVVPQGEGSRRGEARRIVRGGRRPSASPDTGLEERLVRDWSSADAWETADVDARRS